MKFEKLMTLLGEKMDALVQELEFTTKRMFDAAEERETMILLRKVEDLNERLDKLSHRMGFVEFLNNHIAAKQSTSKPSKKKSKRSLQ